MSTGRHGTEMKQDCPFLQHRLEAADALALAQGCLETRCVWFSSSACLFAQHPAEPGLQAACNAS